MRRGSLSALTITQRAGDGQSEVRREKKKREGAGMGKEDSWEPFSTHKTVSVKQ